MPCARGWRAGSQNCPKPIASRIGFKIGAHFGQIIASRLGGDSHQHITAIGDTVNVASRLMEVAASHHADVALSDDLYRAAGDACSVFDSGVLEGTLPDLDPRSIRLHSDLALAAERHNPHAIAELR